MVCPLSTLTLLLGVAAVRVPMWPPKAVPYSKSAGALRGADAAFNEETLRWYLRSVGPLPQLNSTAEIRLSDAVRQLSRWEAARYRLTGELRREPSMHEWASSLPADAAMCLDTLSATVSAHHAGGLPPALTSDPDPEPTCDGWCIRDFRRQLELMRLAKEVMITHNLKLVVCVAKGYVNRGVNLQDLIQEGTFGLITAVEKFDPVHACRFVTCVAPSAVLPPISATTMAAPLHPTCRLPASFPQPSPLPSLLPRRLTASPPTSPCDPRRSYAHYWIHLSISRAVASSSRLIRLPVHANTALSRVKRVRAEFVASNGRTPSSEELAEEAGVTEAKLSLLLASDRDIISLEVRPPPRHRGRCCYRPLHL